MEPLQTDAKIPTVDREHVPKTGSLLVDRFSLLQGGPIYRFQVAIRMAMPDRSRVTQRALFTILITWAPLFVLSLVQGHALGPQVQVPFLHDIGVNVRFLIALPLLVVAEFVIDPRLNYCVRYFVTSGLVNSAQLPAFEEAIARAMRLRDAWLPSALLIVAAFAPSFWHRKSELMAHGITNWHGIATPGGDVLSLAGWWFGIVSLPLFRLLLFRWLWLIFIWAVFLRSVSKLDLDCVPTHPDEAGGLDFLTHAQILFGFIGFINSTVIAGSLGNAIAYEGATVSSVKFLIITFCVLAILIIAAPLLVLTPKLLQLKQKGLFQYSALGTAYTQAFARKWVPLGRSNEENLLGTADIQSLADLANSFSIVRQMKVSLIDKKVLLGLAVPVILPMIPLILAATPADQLVKAVLKLLL